MKKTQRGFSIVGLIIVAGIIGVLTSIGNPLYNDYMTRAKVAEALTLLGVLKNPMVEYYNKRNEWPPIAKVDGKTTGRYTSTIVQGGPETWPNNIGIVLSRRLRMRLYRINFYPRIVGQINSTTTQAGINE